LSCWAFVDYKILIIINSLPFNSLGTNLQGVLTTLPGEFGTGSWQEWKGLGTGDWYGAKSVYKC